MDIIEFTDGTWVKYKKLYIKKVEKVQLMKSMIIIKGLIQNGKSRIKVS